MTEPKKQLIPEGERVIDLRAHQMKAFGKRLCEMEEHKMRMYSEIQRFIHQIMLLEGEIQALRKDLNAER